PAAPVCESQRRLACGPDRSQRKDNGASGLQRDRVPIRRQHIAQNNGRDAALQRQLDGGWAIGRRLLIEAQAELSIAMERARGEELDIEGKAVATIQSQRRGGRELSGEGAGTRQGWLLGNCNLTRSRICGFHPGRLTNADGGGECQRRLVLDDTDVTCY